jgi:bifunctional DNase/RNase
LNCAASDAIVLTTKKGVPIAVADEIMEVAGIILEPSLSEEASSQSDWEIETVSAFRDFIEQLDLTGIGGPT